MLIVQSVHTPEYTRPQWPNLDILPQWNYAGQQAPLKQMLTGHSQAFSFSVYPQLMLSWEMNTQRLIRSADWKESNLKAKVRMSQLGSEFIPRQSISQYQSYNISSFKRPLWHFQFSAKHAISPDSCYITRHTISEWQFSKTVCKPWLEYSMS